jgi:hypothetical protein
VLNVSYHGGRAVTGVDVVLLDTGVTPDGEKSGGGTVVADSSDAVSRWYSFVGYSFGTDIPCTSLTVMSRVSTRI